MGTTGTVCASARSIRMLAIMPTLSERSRFGRADLDVEDPRLTIGRSGDFRNSACERPSLQGLKLYRQPQLLI